MMEVFSVEKSLYDIDDHVDLKEIWDPDFDSSMTSEVDRFGGGGDPDWGQLLDHQPVVLNDRMITEAAQSPRIQSEHSYSLSAGGGDDLPPSSPLDFGKDLESDCFSMSSSSTSSSMPGAGSAPAAMDVVVHVKEEPLSAPASPFGCCPASPPPRKLHRHRHHQPTIVLATAPNAFGRHHHHHQPLLSRVSVKIEPPPGFGLPPTPPSSHSSCSDSDGSLSPVYSQQPSSPSGLLLASPPPPPKGAAASSSKVATASSSSPLISSQPKGATGVIFLTEEEKRTLLAEGYPVPTRLPLTKSEEKSLKKIRRKIKNKISAQESRRKKKEYMDTLEKRVENLAYENCEYKRKLDSLESSNRSLLSQLHRLQSMLSELPSSRTVCTQTLTPRQKSARSAAKS